MTRLSKKLKGNDDMKKFGAGLITGAMIGGVAGAMLDKKCKGGRCSSTTFRSIGAMIDSMMK